MNKNRQNRGITLIALVITIVVLIILAGVTINVMLNNNGIIGKAEQAKVDTQRETAIERMNLKITKAQINCYAENTELPTLQQVADMFCEDEDFEYVRLASKVASLEKITITDGDSICTKLKEYPYEFEINSSMQLASIDGVQVAQTEQSEEIEKLKQTLSSLQKKPVLIKRDRAPSNNTLANNTWTTLEQVSLAGHGTGIAIISYNATTCENTTNLFNIEMLDQNSKYIGNDGYMGTSPMNWVSASASSTISYDENTKINFRAYVSSGMKVHYSYSITLFED